MSVRDTDDWIVVPSMSDLLSKLEANRSPVVAMIGEGFARNEPVNKPPNKLEANKPLHKLEPLNKYSKARLIQAWMNSAW